MPSVVRGGGSAPGALFKKVTVSFIEVVAVSGMGWGLLLLASVVMMMQPSIAICLPDYVLALFVFATP